MNIIKKEARWTKELSFCSNCDYAISKIQIEMARFDYLCPRCENINISMFYSYGSTIWKKRRGKEND